MVAVKQLDERKFQPEHFEVISSEFSSLHKIINRNIVAYKQIILDENLIYVVTEYVDNGTKKRWVGLWFAHLVFVGSIYDLIQKSGTISEPQIVRFTRQIVAALSHLQDLKIVHRYG